MSGVLNEIRPLYMVPTQVKTLIAEKTATSMLRSPKTAPSNPDIPATNM